ncbi:hypothetical protein BV25DRAFT_1830827 [Artomyces pyxidatus]|uniref:Uncharacterized protein n=1 Tax=Artomyces pyxidatus TaxID=48021 RepID=A0ACB8SNG3_9AGAM|nr:hypothetical protein BV25DRAFT_1830827 [Artomyces pyxidatus]
MGGFHFYQDGKALHPLTPDDVLSLVKSGDLILPTEEEIRGWSRGDVLSKAIAVFQTLWFVVQCIGRRVEDLPMTQLEIMTLAYATMTVAMYGFWWYKPLNIGSPVRVAGVRLPEAQPPMTDDQYLQALRFVAGVQDWFVEMRKHSRVPTFYSGGVSSDQNHEVVGDVVALVAATVFGAIHCAAWNSAFPSGAEVLIWRISSVAIVAAPASVFAALLLDMYLDNMSSAGFMVSTMVVTMVTSVSGGVYIVARLLLLALSFTTLRSLPAGAYQTVQWTVHIPHFT